jgi:hypothetical protein
MRSFKSSCLVWTLVSGTLVTGCAIDGGDADDGVDGESLNEVTSELNLGRWYSAWGTTSGADHDVGVDSDWTCFLAGVAGNLNAGWGWDDGGSPSIARLFISGGEWKLSARGGRDVGDVVIGNPVNAHAVCISTAADRTFYSDGGPGHFLNQKKYLEPVQSGRQCFLTEVSGYSGSWSSSAARVRLIQENGNWYLETANIGQSAGIPKFSAVCFDLPRGTWVGTGTRGAANPGSVTYNMLYEATAGVCGLTGIQGPLKYDEWDDGAMITWPASSPGVWTLRVEDGKRGWVTCLH